MSAGSKGMDRAPGWWGQAGTWVCGVHRRRLRAQDSARKPSPGGCGESLPGFCAVFTMCWCQHALSRAGSSRGKREGAESREGRTEPLTGVFVPWLASPAAEQRGR